MICLDTNAVSEIGKPLPSAVFVDWMKRQDHNELYLPSPVIMELAYGAEKAFLRSGTRRYHLFLDDMFGNRFRDRILDFVGEAPLICGRLRARRGRAGKPIDVVDAMIAAICIANGAALATRNIGDFAGLDLRLINPFEPA